MWNMHRLIFIFLATGSFFIYLPPAHATAMMNGLSSSGFNWALLVYLLLCAISLGNAWASNRLQRRRGITFSLFAFGLILLLPVPLFFLFLSLGSLILNSIFLILLCGYLLVCIAIPVHSFVLVWIFKKAYNKRMDFRR